MLLDKCMDSLGRFGIDGDVVRRHVVPVDITEAVRMFFEDARARAWNWYSDFPTMVCPWPFAWLEWKLLPSFYERLGERPDPMRCAVMIVRDSWDSKKGPPQIHPFLEMANAKQPALRTQFQASTPALAKQVHWVQSMQLYVETIGPQKILGGCELYDYLDEAGVSIHAQDGRAARHMFCYKKALQYLFFPVAFAISLMHCKNVSIIDKPVPEKVQKARERRGKEPKVIYKTLVIEPMKRILRTEGQSQKLGLQRAMHICRGHFKDYGAKGLFGQASHKGIYWWESHVRGTAEAGEVVKDYKVVPKEVTTP